MIFRNVVCLHMRYDLIAQQNIQKPLLCLRWVEVRQMKAHHSVPSWPCLPLLEPPVPFALAFSLFSSFFMPFYGHTAPVSHFLPSPPDGVVAHICTISTGNLSEFDNDLMNLIMIPMFWETGALDKKSKSTGPSEAWA